MNDSGFQLCRSKAEIGAYERVYGVLYGRQCKGVWSEWEGKGGLLMLFDGVEIF